MVSLSFAALAPTATVFTLRLHPKTAQAEIETSPRPPRLKNLVVTADLSEAELAGDYTFEGLEELARDILAPQIS